ncbi:MAG: hypothetical protein M3256_05140 [Actinomycetota bacterium]|nr:hypothetical protein [Actinomycetota bacterium]
MEQRPAALGVRVATPGRGRSSVLGGASTRATADHHHSLRYESRGSGTGAWSGLGGTWRAEQNGDGFGRPVSDRTAQARRDDDRSVAVTEPHQPGPIRARPLEVAEPWSTSTVTGATVALAVSADVKGLG